MTFVSIMYLVVADISLVTLIPAKLKKAIERMVVQKAPSNIGLWPSWYYTKIKRRLTDRTHKWLDAEKSASTKVCLGERSQD